jgi:hypothetical protein
MQTYFAFARAMRSCMQPMPVLQTGSISICCMQTALRLALQLVSNSPDYGLSQSPLRAQAVMRVFWDLRATWELRSDLEAS